VDVGGLLNITRNKVSGLQIGHNVKDAICGLNIRIIDALIHIEPESFA
jgi:hypothetical protein